MPTLEVKSRNYLKKRRFVGELALLVHVFHVCCRLFITFVIIIKTMWVSRRVIHGYANNPQFGKLLSSDPWKKLSWCFGPDAILNFLGKSPSEVCLFSAMRFYIFVMYVCSFGLLTYLLPCYTDLLFLRVWTGMDGCFDCEG